MNGPEESDQMADNKASETPMTAARFTAIIAAYGADPARWPADEREAAQAFAKVAPIEATPILTEARRLDAMLDGLPEPAAASDAQGDAIAHLRAAAKPGRLSQIKAWLGWQGPIWQPAGAVAAAMMFGLVLGIEAPHSLPFSAIAQESQYSPADASDPTAPDLALFVYGPAAPDPLDRPAQQTEGAQ
jgi:hypothetical protein